MEKDDAIFYALLRMGHKCTHAIIPHPNPLSKKIENTWLIEVEHGHNDLGKHGQYTFCYENREKRIKICARLNRSANDLFAFYLTHLNGEEATILPAMWKHFTDDQLTAMRSNVETNMSMERYPEWMSWMFPSLNINELTGMFMGLKKAPAPVRENMSRIAEKALGPDRWIAVKARAGL